MADDDEIDVLGDFSFNSCLAQNTQGIPSCSDREDTVHPQWLLDSTANNWYDTKIKDSNRHSSSRYLSVNSSFNKYESASNTTWTAAEKNILDIEMEKYGRNIKKISQKLKTKTEAEIQALIEAEYGINLEVHPQGLEKHEDCDGTPAVVQEEIVTDEISNFKNVIDLVTTGSTTIKVPKHPFRKKNHNVKSKISFSNEVIDINSSQILYEDDIVLGSTELVGNDIDSLDIVSRTLAKNHKEKVKAEKKMGNHRRKNSNSGSKSKRCKSKDLFSSPPRQRKDSNKSEDNMKSPKMQIVLGSGWSLPVSEGEEVIKIEKKKDDSESDIEVDIDSGDEVIANRKDQTVKEEKRKVEEPPVAVHLRKFEPMPKRKKKINLDGGGGYTIMHTESGDLYEVASEPRKERQPKKAAINLIQCHMYSTEKPAPYEVRLYVSSLIAMDVHAHTSRGEVMGLLGGELRGTTITFQAYRRAAAASCSTHCDMDPVSQSAAAESLQHAGMQVCGWHHSHPLFPPAPSALDLRTQAALQTALERYQRPFLGVITSQHWPTGRAASQYRCIRVEEGNNKEEVPTGYQFSVKLVADVTCDTVSELSQQLCVILRDSDTSEYSVDMPKDVCPQAGITYLEKCISSIRHHMLSSGYTDDDSVVKQLIEGIRDVFR